MTIETQLLATRLAQAVVLVLRTAAPDLPIGLAADVQRALRRFGALQHERNALECAVAAAPAEQRAQLQLRVTSFDAGLTAVLGHAARLIYVRTAQRRRAGEVAGISDIQAVQQLGARFGRPLDPARVRRTAQWFVTRPVGASEAPEPGTLVETLFIALALVAALAAQGPVASA